MRFHHMAGRESYRRKVDQSGSHQISWGVVTVAMREGGALVDELERSRKLV